jgi:hypothetical protein
MCIVHHLQLNILPLPASPSGPSVLKRLSKILKLHAQQLEPGQSLDVSPAQQLARPDLAYLHAVIDSFSFLVYFKNSRRSSNLGREVACDIFNAPEGKDWRAVQDREEEDVTQFELPGQTTQAERGVERQDVAALRAKYRDL